MGPLRGKILATAAGFSQRLGRLARRLARRPVVLALVGGLAAASAAGVLSSLFPMLAPFGDLQAHLSAAAAVAAAACLAIRSRAWAAAAAVVLAANLAVVGSRLAAVDTCAVQAAASGQHVLRVMTLNVWGRNGDAAAVADAVARHRPDLLLLQELRPQHAALLDRLRGLYAHRILCDAHDDCGIAVLSTHPLDRLRVVGDDTLMLVETRARANGRELVLLTTHMLRPYYGRGQAHQFAALAEEVERMPANSVVAGDFNSTLWSANLSRFVQRAGVCAGNAGHATWPSWLGPLGLPIDHVFLKEGVSLFGIRTVTGTGSDHRGLLFTVGLR
jgi:endonuclease/exonuclease/phosphatase (EEP) superfamily protein YafD